MRTVTNLINCFENRPVNQPVIKVIDTPNYGLGTELEFDLDTGSQITHVVSPLFFC